MSSSRTALHDASESHHNMMDHKRPSEGEELRLNIAQLKLGDGCLRKQRLLGSPSNQEYETYSLPVSRVRPNSDILTP
jgi:hypothetical protein